MSSIDDALSDIQQGLASAPAAASPSAPPPSSIDQALSDINGTGATPTATTTTLTPQEAKPRLPPDVAPTSLGQAREAASLVTSGLSDKAIAAAEGVGSWLRDGGFQKGYQAGLAGDPYAEEFRARHPIIAPAVGVAGALATALLMPEAAAATLPGRIAQGAAIGAGTGAATGYGLSANAPGRDTAIGAALGATTGGIFPLVTGAAQPLLRGFAGKLPWTSEATAVDQAQQAVASRITQDAAAGGPGIPDMLTALRNVPTKPMSLTDVGGENLQALAGSVARQPGPARQMMRQLFTDRDVAAGDRLINDIDSSIAGGSSAHDAVNALLQRRSQDARPLYEQAFTNSPVVGSDRIQAAIKDPILQEGLATGIRLQRLENTAEAVAGRPQPFNPNDYRVDYDLDGTPRFQLTPNLRTLDAAKRGLDAMLSSDTYRNQYGQLTQMGRAINGVRGAFVGALDDATGGPNGAYAQARAAWAGPSRSLEMIKNGQSFLSMTPDEVRDTVSGLPPSDRQFFQLGVADRLRQNVIDTALNADESKRLINSQGIKNRLRPMFVNDQAFNDFVNNVMAERTMKEGATRILGGSQTAARVAEDATGHGETSVLGNLAAGAGALLAHEPFAAAPMIYRGVRGLGDWLQLPNPKVNTEISRMLSRTSLPENEAILQGLTPASPSRIMGVAPAVSGIVPQTYFNQRPQGSP